MTFERASEIVSCMPSSQEKFDLFSHFEEQFNPYPAKDIHGNWSEQAANWSEMFASMCGFGIARLIVIVP